MQYPFSSGKSGKCKTRKYFCFVQRRSTCWRVFGERFEETNISKQMIGSDTAQLSPLGKHDNHVHKIQNDVFQTAKRSRSCHWLILTGRAGIWFHGMVVISRTHSDTLEAVFNIC